MELSLHVIGGKWKPLILYHLSRTKQKRFGEIRRCIPNITQKMLTQQLRELEYDGMLNRKIYAQVPPKVEYSLTELGKTFMPVMEALCKWGQGYEDKFTLMDEKYGLDTGD